MNIRILIDNIIRQTTILIAQISTSAGVRAPLSRIADDVFLSLAREIEAQGVGRKVAADMFGLALRGYQKKTRRLAESSSNQGKTLFEAVLEFIENEGGTNRKAILQRFHYDGERETIGILNDLHQSGLIYSTRKGNDTLYNITSEVERQRLTRQIDTTALCDIILGEIYRTPHITIEVLAEKLAVSQEQLESALSLLKDEGHISQDAHGQLRASTFQIPVGADHGWESAVFDHFQAVATGIANKLSLRAGRNDASEFVGGTTLRFELSAQHPYKQEVLQLLSHFRKHTDALWQRVGEYNDSHPLSDEQRFKVTFYFGQDLDDPELAIDNTKDKTNKEEDILS